MKQTWITVFGPKMAKSTEETKIKNCDKMPKISSGNCNDWKKWGPRGDSAGIGDI